MTHDEISEAFNAPPNVAAFETVRAAFKRPDLKATAAYRAACEVVHRAVNEFNSNMRAKTP